MAGLQIHGLSWVMKASGIGQLDLPSARRATQPFPGGFSAHVARFPKDHRLHSCVADAAGGISKHSYLAVVTMRWHHNHQISSTVRRYRRVIANWDANSQGCRVFTHGHTPLSFCRKLPKNNTGRSVKKMAPQNGHLAVVSQAAKLAMDMQELL